MEQDVAEKAEIAVIIPENEECDDLSPSDEDYLKLKNELKKNIKSKKIQIQSNDDNPNQIIPTSYVSISNGDQYYSFRDEVCDHNCPKDCICGMVSQLSKP